MAFQVKPHEGDELCKLIVADLRQLAKEFIVPEQLELSLEQYKVFMEFLDNNPKMKGGEERLGYVKMNGEILYIVPSPKLVEMKLDENGDKVLDKDQNPIEKPILYRVS